MIAAWAALALASAHAAASTPSDRVIRIGIIPDAERVAFVCAGRCGVSDARGRRYALVPGREYALEPAANAIRLGSLTLPTEARISPGTASGAVLIAGRRYPGSIIARLTPAGGLSVIDELLVEDYLLGVLPREMDPGWPLEALKAQAVVARTFAYTQAGKYRRDGYDLSSDTRSQMFVGLGSEGERIRRAVRETRGEVLGYKGKILNVYYHACCGGHTESASAVWGPGEWAPPPLRGVRDRYCRSTPLARWTAYFPYEEVLAALSQDRLIAGVIRRFAINRRTAAGYARDFAVAVGSEYLRVKAGEFRKLIGNSDLKSIRIERVLRRSGGIEFVGSGSGHGVGLCQWGAKIQADRGRGYEQILRFYFPGSTLSVIDE